MAIWVTMLAYWPQAFVFDQKNCHCICFCNMGKVSRNLERSRDCGVCLWCQFLKEYIFAGRRQETGKCTLVLAAVQTTEEFPKVFLQVWFTSTVVSVENVLRTRKRDTLGFQQPLSEAFHRNNYRLAAGDLIYRKGSTGAYRWWLHPKGYFHSQNVQDRLCLQDSAYLPRDEQGTVFAVPKSLAVETGDSMNPWMVLLRCLLILLMVING